MSNKENKENLEVNIIADNEEKYRVILDDSSDPIFSFNPDGEYLFVNKAFADGVGKKQYDIIGKKIWDVFPKEEADKRYAAVQWVFKNAKAKVIEVRVSRNDGDRFYITTVKPVLNEQNEVTTVICISKEITERKANEEALRISEARLRRAELASKSGNWEINIDTQIMVASEGAVKIYGLKNNTFKFDSIKNIPLPEYRQLLDASLKYAIEENKTYDVEFKIKTADTAELKVIHSIGQFDKEKKTLFGVIQDITNQKIIEECLRQNEIRLQELNATKDMLFSIIAHDLRNPIGSILSFSELLYENIPDYDAEQSKKILELINSSSKQTLNLLENLLTWANTQTGQIEFLPESLNLQSVIQDIVDVLKTSAKIKNISLNYFQSDEIIIRADYNMLQTIIRNLISNAIKFTNTYGKVDVYAIANGNQIEITVADNGVGMNKDTLNKLFQMNSNITTSGTANEKGSGLGLILCKEFIEKHGGKIWVESKIDKGSRFHVSLPRH